MTEPIRILMCAPDHYDVDYVINPWMEGNIHKSSQEKAVAQWSKLNHVLNGIAKVDLVQGQKGVPDMVFTANAGLVLGDNAVLSRFYHPERQGEEPHFKKWFEDNGFNVFELPKDLPFEGAGVISKWRLELPQLKQFDYNTISDVIIHMSYTSCEGGEQLKKIATENLITSLESAANYSQYALFDLKHDFAQEWYKHMQGADSSYTLIVSDLMSRLPYITNGKNIDIGSLVEVRDEKNNVLLAKDRIAININGTEQLKILFGEKIEERLWLIFGYKIR